MENGTILSGDTHHAAARNRGYCEELAVGDADRVENQSSVDAEDLDLERSVVVAHLDGDAAVGGIGKDGARRVVGLGSEDRDTALVDHSQGILARFESGGDEIALVGVARMLLGEYRPRLRSRRTIKKADGVESGGGLEETVVETGVIAVGATADIVEHSLELGVGVDRAIDSPVAIGNADNFGVLGGREIGASPVVNNADVRLSRIGSRAGSELEMSEREVDGGTGLRDGERVADSGKRERLVDINQHIQRSERQLELLIAAKAAEREDAVGRLAVGAEESERHTIGKADRIGAHGMLTYPHGAKILLRGERVDHIIDKSGTEDVELEEIMEVDAAIKAERVADLVAVHSRESIAGKELTERGVEQRVAEIAAQRMPNSGTLVVDGAAVGIIGRLPIERLVAIVGKVSGAEHALEIGVGIVLVVVAIGVERLHGHLLAERGAPFVEPHVGAGGASYEIAEPRVAEFVSDNRLAVLGHADHAAGDESDVGGMLHRAFGRGHIANPTPAVRAETTLVHGEDVGEAVVGIVDLGRVVILEGDDGGIGIVKSCVGALDGAPGGHRNGDKISGRGLREDPNGSVTAVGVEVSGVGHTRADGTPARLRRDLETEGGLIVEIVATGEPGTAEVVGILVESDAKVVVDGVVHVEAAPTIGLDIAARAVEDLERERIAHLPRGRGDDEDGTDIGEIGEGGTVDQHRVDRSINEVEANSLARAQQRKPNFGKADDAIGHGVRDVELEVVAEDIDRIGLKALGTEGAGPAKKKQ